MRVRVRTDLGVVPPISRFGQMPLPTDECGESSRPQRAAAPKRNVNSPASVRGSPPIGDEDMVSPAKGAHLTVALGALRKRRNAGSSTPVRVSSLVGRRGGLAKAGPWHTRTAGFAGHSSDPFQPLQTAPLVPPSPVPLFALPRAHIGKLGGSGSSARALPQRVLHGQQNAHRRRPSGRDPGGGAPR